MFGDNDGRHARVSGSFGSGVRRDQILNLESQGCNPLHQIKRRRGRWWEIL
jgi:hypothetical protein